MMHRKGFNLAVVSICALMFLSLSHPLAAQEPTPRPTFVNEHSDLNRDHVVDSEDLLIFMQDWGKVTGPEQIITINIPGLPEDARPLRLVRIPAGSFQMGSPDTERSRDRDEGPVHTVNIGYDFYMGETEVTQAQWQAITGKSIHDQRDLAFPAWSLDGVGNDYPVYYVSWDEISQSNGFLDRLNALGQGTFRLPSEAEWEYACRAGTATRFYFGDSLGCADDYSDCAAGTLPGNRSDYMWYWGNHQSPTYGSKPVAGKLPNAFGLFDMHGNVEEWCQDYWYDNYVGAPTNGNPWVIPNYGINVVRGGDWYYGAWNCRSADRGGHFPETRHIFVGVRVVLPASSKSF